MSDEIKTKETAKDVEKNMAMDEGTFKKEKVAGGRFPYAMLFVLSAFLVGAAVQYFVPHLFGFWQMPTSKWPAKVMELQARLDQLEAQFNAIELHSASLTSPSVPAQDHPASSLTRDEESAVSADLVKIKESLQTVSSLIGVLQTQMDQSSLATQNVKVTAQAGLATVLAFVQMQNKALSGQSFEEERQALRALAGDDQIMIDLLLKLEPAAVLGVRTCDELVQDWHKVTGKAQNALNQAEAKTWKDRLVTALNGMISIRSLKAEGMEPLSFTSVGLELKQCHVRRALDKVKAMPEAVHKVVVDWKKKAVLRATMEDDLADLVKHLIASGNQQTIVTPVPVVQGGVPVEQPAEAKP